MLYQKISFLLQQKWLVFILVHKIQLVWKQLEGHWIKGKHIKYQQVNQLKWQNLHWKIITFNFQIKSINKFQEQQQALSIAHLMLEYLWIKWNVISTKLRSFNFLYCLGTLTIFLSSGLMVKTFSKILCCNLITLILISSLFMSLVSISFLNLNVKLSNGKLQTSLYVKPTRRHQQFHFQSSHPKHTKRSVVYSQTLRVSRECSQEEDYKNYCNQLKSWFLNLSYPEHLIDIEMKKFKFKSREKSKKK